MTFSKTIFLVAGAADLASAHFGVEYPIWRGDSLDNESYSQWSYPCAGVPTDLEYANRTDWPLTGGSLILDLHHPWSYIFINLGFGANASNFNYTFTPQFLNQTGNGTLCIPQLEIPVAAAAIIADGVQASIQVVTSGQSGSSLYNCADITFRENATTLPSNACHTDEGLSFVTVGQVNETSGSGGSGGTSGAGLSAATNTLTLSSIVGLAIVIGII